MTRILLSLVLAALVLTGCEEDSSVQADSETNNPSSESVSSANMAASVAFLNEMSESEGVQATGTGLLYEVIEQGEGPKPNAASTVTVHYEGTLPDGTVFDSSYARGQTISFPLSRVISGWTEGLQLMSPGAKYKFYIPPQLAYGQMGTPGGPIGPNQALVFTVELFSFE